MQQQCLVGCAPTYKGQKNQKKPPLRNTNILVETSYIMKRLTTGSLFPLINVSFKPFKSEHTAHECLKYLALF